MPRAWVIDGYVGYEGTDKALEIDALSPGWCREFERRLAAAAFPSKLERIR
jgi:hypothetical protein